MNTLHIPQKLIVSLTTLLLCACQTAPQLHPDAAPTHTPAVITSPVARPVSAPASDAQPLAEPPQTSALAVIPPELLQAPDLWGHLRRGFAVPVLDHELVSAHAKRFAASGFMAARADRIRLYLPLIIEELEQRQMPLGACKRSSAPSTSKPLPHV